MARGPSSFDERKRFDAVKYALRRLREDVVVRADGQPDPPREHLEAIAKRLIYEDLPWLIERIEGGWE